MVRWYTALFGVLALTSSGSASAASDDAKGAWVILPPNVHQTLGQKAADTIIEVAEEELRDAGYEIVTRERVQRLMEVIGFGGDEVTEDDLQDITGGFDATHALVIALEKSGRKVAWSLQHYDAVRRLYTNRSGDVRRLAILRVIREEIRSLLSTSKAPKPKPEKAPKEAQPQPPDRKSPTT